jgi:hypothetical protein
MPGYCKNGSWLHAPHTNSQLLVAEDQSEDELSHAALQIFFDISGQL